VTSKKKAPHVILGAIFARIFREFAHIFRDFVKVFRDFAHILRDFAQSFTKSKLLGVRLHSLHPHLLHLCTGPRKFRDIITPPGPWKTCGLLSCGCGWQVLPHQAFLGHSERVNLDQRKGPLGQDQVCLTVAYSYTPYLPCSQWCRR